MQLNVTLRALVPRKLLLFTTITTNGVMWMAITMITFKLASCGGGVNSLALVTRWHRHVVLQSGRSEDLVAGHANPLVVFILDQPVNKSLEHPPLSTEVEFDVVPLTWHDVVIDDATNTHVEFLKIIVDRGANHRFLVGEHGKINRWDGVLQRGNGFLQRVVSIGREIEDSIAARKDRRHDS
jgi:hypothetical protein